ncbi:MAG: hypothetical protein EZS28_021402 [Streblomastix strix]|uniref:Uncharacterized protein n=1 Tax=Streblomastix strix TaxID=222440 RepID=A0A5J4VKG6_9EUKA|nr:MAG: hypothetical protein EZS28_021402 [Streblomastix strix]
MQLWFKEKKYNEQISQYKPAVPSPAPIYLISILNFIDGIHNEVREDYENHSSQPNVFQTLVLLSTLKCDQLDDEKDIMNNLLHKFEKNALILKDIKFVKGLIFAVGTAGLSLEQNKKVIGQAKAGINDILQFQEDEEQEVRVVMNEQIEEEGSKEEIDSVKFIK